MTVGVRGEDILLYDSSFNGSLSLSLELQLTQLYGETVEAHGLMISAPSFQQQHGENNCGLFAVAAAYHHCLKDNLGKISFTEEKMRSH